MCKSYSSTLCDRDGLSRPSSRIIRSALFLKASTLWEGQDDTSSRKYHSFEQVFNHIEDASVPCGRCLPNLSGDFAHFGIYRVEYAGQVTEDTANQYFLNHSWIASIINQNSLLV